MRSDGSIIGFGHPRDQPALKDPAGMAKVRLQDGGSTFLKDLPEAPFGEDAFSCGYGKMGFSCQVSHHIHILAIDGLFDEEGLVRFECLDQEGGILGTDSPVEIDADISIFTGSFTQ